MAIIDPHILDRLQSQLLTSGIQQSNPALYQVIKNLITFDKQLVTIVNAGGIVGPIGPTGPMGPIGLSGTDGEDSDWLMKP